VGGNKFNEEMVNSNIEFIDIHFIRNYYHFDKIGKCAKASKGLFLGK